MTDQRRTPRRALSAVFVAAEFGPSVLYAAPAAQDRHAEALYDAAFATNPRSLKDRIGCGLVRAWLKECEPAAEDFRAALAIDPGGAVARQALIRHPPSATRRGRRCQSARRWSSSPNGLVPKAEFWVGRARGASTEYTLLAREGIPVTAKFRLEPTNFLGKNAADEGETHGLMFGEYRFDNGAALDAGIADGSKSHAHNPASPTPVAKCCSRPACLCPVSFVPPFRPAAKAVAACPIWISWPSV